MNSYERYLSVLQQSRPDVLPRVPILMQYAAEYIGSDYGEFAADYRVMVKANEQCAQDFGFDQLSCISDPYRETQGFGAEIEYRRDGPPRSSTLLAGSKDLGVLAEPDPAVSERMRDRVQAVERYKADCGGAYSILGWIEGPAAEATDLRGITTFLMDLFDDREFTAELMDRCVAVGAAFARAQIDAGADTVGIGDAIASQVDPNTYESLIQPREKQLVQAIHDAGAYAKLHICGDITHLLPGIADLGVDIVDIDHMVDLAAVRDAVGSGVVITGNLDPVAGVKNSTPDRIRDEVKKEYASAGNPYMVNAGCEIPPGTPVENIKALCAPLTVI